jgi:hypothetical protein
MLAATMLVVPAMLAATATAAAARSQADAEACSAATRA